MAAYFGFPVKGLCQSFPYQTLFFNLFVKLQQAYKNFEIPTEMVNVWRYLEAAYGSDAFQESCPADREIITQYNNKASCQPKVAFDLDFYWAYGYIAL